MLVRLAEEDIFSFLCKQTLKFYGKKISRLSKQGAFFRAHINTAQNLLIIAPCGSKQGVFWALTHTEKNTVKNGRLVM